MRSRVWVTVFGYLALAVGVPPARAVGAGHIHADTVLNVRTLQTVSAASAWPGMRVTAVVDESIGIGRDLVILRGAPAVLEVVDVTPLSNTDGPDRIVFRVLTIRAGKRVYSVGTNDVLFIGPSERSITTESGYRIPADTWMQFRLHSLVRVHLT
jgi:hypothetical protein